MIAWIRKLKKNCLAVTLISDCQQYYVVKSEETNVTLSRLEIIIAPDHRSPVTLALCAIRPALAEVR